MCESWEPARRVLERRFPGVNVARDVETYTPAMDYDLLSAGFPCVDLSHAGRQHGIFGPQSGLVRHVFRIARISKPEWILIENVPNLLRLHRGAGIEYILRQLEALGYRWAYRTIDSRAFGVPQRRHRVIILATNGPSDPSSFLFRDDAGEPDSRPEGNSSKPSGFYWTEGRRGVGLVSGAVPTLKGGSTVGLPSAPAIWFPDAPLGRQFVLPRIEDAEVLQGFDRDWTLPADVEGWPSSRWKLVGNAVTVGVGSWLGSLLARNIVGGPPELTKRNRERAWPEAGLSHNGEEYQAHVSRRPLPTPMIRLEDIVEPAKAQPLSYRATRGFLSRIEESGIALPKDFMEHLERHLQIMSAEFDAATRNRPRRGSVRLKATKTAGEHIARDLRRMLSDSGSTLLSEARPERDLRWRPDFLIPGAKVFVEVHGCFWSGCEKHRDWPADMVKRWAERIEANRIRSAQMKVELGVRGWTGIELWEHDDIAFAAKRLRSILQNAAVLPTQQSRAFIRAS